MRLTREDKIAIAERLPDVQLSYDDVLHRKVRADIIMAVPDGQRCLLWFTSDKKGDLVYQLDLNPQNNICGVSIRGGIFSSALCNGQGTLLSGYIFAHRSVSMFTCLDLLWYKGQDMKGMDLPSKLSYLSTLLSVDTRMVANTKSDIVLGMAPLGTSFSDVVSKVRDLPYKIAAFRLCKAKGSNFVLGRVPCKIAPVTTAVFQVKPRLYEDIYELHCSDSKNSFHSIAGLQTYEASVMMNKLFRRIKENDNLDLLEESDDEGEFEDENERKFVKDVTFNMRCSFNRRLRRWVPTEVVKEGPVRRQDVRAMEEAMLGEKVVRKEDKKMKKESASTGRRARRLAALRSHLEARNNDA
jgi:hypothetical protein